MSQADSVDTIDPSGEATVPVEAKVSPFPFTIDLDLWDANKRPGLRSSFSAWR